MTSRFNFHYCNVFFLISLLCLSLISVAHADDEDVPMMGPMGMMPMMGGMGMGQMGMMPMMGGMGMGQMGMMPMMGGMGPCQAGMMPMMGYMGMGRFGMGRMGMHGFFYMLDLSNEQRKAIRDIHRKTRAEFLQLQDDMVELNDQLYDLYDQDKPDAAKIGATYDKLFNIKRQVIELNIKAMNQQYDVLTKEQKDKLKELRTGMMGYGRGFRYRGGMMHDMMR